MTSSQIAGGSSSESGHRCCQLSTRRLAERSITSPLRPACVKHHRQITLDSSDTPPALITRIQLKTDAPFTADLHCGILFLALKIKSEGPDISRLAAFLKRCKRYCYGSDNFPTVSELFSDADDQLFSRTSHIQTHVLMPLLPTNTQHSYNLRERSHNYSLINKDSHINDRHFIVRLLYKHAY